MQRRTVVNTDWLLVVGRWLVIFSVRALSPAGTQISISFLGPHAHQQQKAYQSIIIFSLYPPLFWFHDYWYKLNAWELLLEQSTWNCSWVRDERKKETVFLFAICHDHPTVGSLLLTLISRSCICLLSSVSWSKLHAIAIIYSSPNYNLKVGKLNSICFLPKRSAGPWSALCSSAYLNRMIFCVYSHELTITTIYKPLHGN